MILIFVSCINNMLSSKQTYKTTYLEKEKEENQKPEQQNKLQII